MLLHSERRGTGSITDAIQVNVFYTCLQYRAFYAMQVKTGRVHTGLIVTYDFGRTRMQKENLLHISLINFHF